MTAREKEKMRNWIAVGAVIFLCDLLFAAETIQDTSLTLAKKAFRDGLYDLAEEKAEDFLKTSTDASKVYEAHLVLGGCFYNQGNSSKALYEFGFVSDAPAASEFRDAALYWSGNIYFHDGDFKRALEFYQKIIDEFPSSRYAAFARYSKGWCYYRLGYFEEATAAFQEVVSKSPFERMAVDAQFKIGDCEYVLGRYDKSEEALKAFIEKFPVSDKTAEAYYLLGEVSFKKGAYKDSIEYLKKAVAISPSARWSVFATYRMANALFRTGDYHDSTREFKKSLVMSHDDSLIWGSLLGLAQNYVKTTSSKEGIKIYDEVMERYPDRDAAADACYQKARLLRDQANYDEAEAILKNAITNHSRSELADHLHYELGRIYWAQANDIEALREFAWVGENSKDASLKVSAILNMGDIRFEMKDYKKAIECFDAVLTDHPRSPMADYAQCQIGNVFLYTERYDQAVLAYQSVLVNFPDTGLKKYVRLGLGTVYFRKNDFERAASEFEEHLRDFPDTRGRRTAELYLANSYYNLNRYAEALSIFENICEGPSSEDMTKEMARYKIGWCYHNMRNERLAVDEFEKFLKEYPDSELASDAKFWLGEYLDSKGQHEKARGYYHSILKDSPSSDIADRALYNLALSLANEGSDREAAKTLVELASGFPDSALRPQAYRKLAFFKKRDGDLDSAIEYFSKALTADDSELNAQIRYEIAECLEEKKDLAGAAREYNKVLELYPKSLFWSIRAHLKCAQVLETLEDWDEARRLYESLARMDVEESKIARERLEWMNQPDRRN